MAGYGGDDGELDRDGYDIQGPRRVEDTPIEVFVHLARDKDVHAWGLAWKTGSLVGFNDETPYGYGRASLMGCNVAFSRSGPEGSAARLFRLALRAVTGFDYLHARRQAADMRRADVVWTHTESQFLAAAAVLGPGHRPKLLGQSVWLFDRWPDISPMHRWLFRRLIRRVDILTVHSTENLASARRLFPRHRSAWVPFGIPAEVTIPPRIRPQSPLNVLGIGSDRHRDWNTLLEAVADQDGASLTILSGTARQKRGPTKARVVIKRAKSQKELLAHLADATVVCVPLLPNKHASGITVIQEAVLAGVPVVATDVGGLSGYFPRDEVLYVPPRDPAAVREAVLWVARHPDAARDMARRAQSRMASGLVGAEAYIRRHVEISHRIMTS